MPEPPLHVVTGAFGYSGRYIAARLLETGVRVRTLTNSPERANPFAGRVQVHPLRFDDPKALARSLRGAAALYNTYWVRFNHREFQHAQAVENSLRLFEAAARAGVRRVVHVSITNPSKDSPLEYFRGKAILEEALMASGLGYAILRPTVLFGAEDILVNNIAWVLRRFPVFGMFGDGQYHLRPIDVEDLARLAVEQAASSENCVIDAVGPERFSYRGLVQMIGEAIGRPRPILALPARLAYGVGVALGWILRDVLITWPEVEGLMQGLLDSDRPAAGLSRLTDWARAHADTLGRAYASELARRRNRIASYEALAGPRRRRR